MKDGINELGLGLHLRPSEAEGAGGQGRREEGRRRASRAVKDGIDGLGLGLHRRQREGRGRPIEWGRSGRC